MLNRRYERYLLQALIQTENPYLCFIFLWFSHCNFRYRVIGLFFFSFKIPSFDLYFFTNHCQFAWFSTKKRCAIFVVLKILIFMLAYVFFAFFSYLIERMDRCMNNVYPVWGYDDGFNPSCSVNQFSSSPTSLCMSAW